MEIALWTTNLNGGSANLSGSGLTGPTGSDPKIYNLSNSTSVITLVVTPPTGYEVSKVIINFEGTDYRYEKPYSWGGIPVYSSGNQNLFASAKRLSVKPIVTKQQPQKTTYYYRARTQYATGASPNVGQLFKWAYSNDLINTSVEATSTPGTKTVTLPAAGQIVTGSDGNKYEFVSWGGHRPGATVSISPTTNGAYTTFVAQYQEITYKYKITYHYGPNDSDKKTDTKTSTSTSYVVEGLGSYDATLLPSIKGQHVFKGWSKTETSTNAISTATMYANTTTREATLDLYALWEVKHEATLNVDLRDTTLNISTIADANQSGHAIYSCTTSEKKLYTYEAYQGSTAPTVTISVADTGIAGFSKPQHDFASYSGNDGKTYSSKFGTISFTFTPSTSSKKSLTLVPTWTKRKYTLKVVYADGTLVGGDSINNKPSDYTSTNENLTHSHTVSCSSTLSDTLKTSKEHNIFLGYKVSYSKASANDTCTVTNGSTIKTTTAIKYTFDANSTNSSVTITLIPQWQSQYIYTIHFNKNSTSASGTSPVTKVVKQLKALSNPPSSYTLTIPIEYGETPFGFSRTDWEVVGWSESTNGSNPITSEKSEWVVNTNGTTYGKTLTLYAVWEETGYGWINTGTASSPNWKKAQPWINIGTESNPNWIKVKKIWIHNGSTWVY